MKKTIFFFLLATGQLLISCRKKKEDPYLRFSAQVVEVAPTPGASVAVAVESNIAWKLATTVDWLHLSKTTGSGRDTVRITVIKDNTEAGPRSAVITAAAVNGPQSTSTRLTITQRPYNFQLLERKTLGGSNDEQVTGIIATPDGGHVVTGFTSSNNSGEVKANHGIYDYWVVRLNSNHDTLWTRVLGGAADDVAVAVAATPDGGFLVAGSTYSAGGVDLPPGIGDRDIWLVKLSGNGNTAWTRRLGGSQYDEVQALTLASDGTIFLAGRTRSTDIGNNLSIHHGGYDMLAMKLAGDGQLLWARTLGGVGSEEGFGAAPAEDGGVVIAGSTQSSNDGDVTGTNRGGRDMWAVRLKSNGDLAWSRLLGGTDFERLNAVTPTADGGFVAVGEFSSSNIDGTGVNKGFYDCIALKLKGNGDTEWISCLGGSDDDKAIAVAVSPDGGFLVAGRSQSDDGDIGMNKGQYDGYLAKLDAGGRKVWSKALGGAEDDYFMGIAMKQNGSFVVAGHTFSNNSGDVNTASKGERDWWLINVTDH